MSTSLLVLWDIDHTLIDTGGVGSEIYAAAFEKVTGQPLERMPDTAGRTEPVIFREALELHHLQDTAGLYDEFAQAQAQGYAERTGDMRQQGRALPGAADALHALSQRDDALQSVLTGNTRPASQIKLATFSLDTHLDLDIGAYGTDRDIRAQLVDVARQRATARTGHTFSPGTTVLIGDTPADVTAAHDGNARIIAVASGNHTEADLATAGASTVLPDLADTPALLAALFPGKPRQ